MTIQNSLPRVPYSTSKIFTILVSDWSAAGVCRLSDVRITSNSNQSICPLPYSDYTEEQLQTINSMGLFSNGQGDGWLELIATMNIPTIDIQLEMIFRGEK